MNLSKDEGVFVKSEYKAILDNNTTIINNIYKKRFLTNYVSSRASRGLGGRNGSPRAAIGIDPNRALKCHQNVLGKNSYRGEDPKVGLGYTDRNIKIMNGNLQKISREGSSEPVIKISHSQPNLLGNLETSRPTSRSRQLGLRNINSI